MTVRITTLTLVAFTLSLGACKKQAPPEPLTAAIEVGQDQLPPVPQQVVQQMRANFQRVHFAYDSSVLDGGSKEALAANAKLMQQYPSLTVEVQGHCDERGTIDYNVALGNRRAAAVHTWMTQMGVSPSRVTTISYGEERPVAPGAGEVAWSQNRRAEFRVLAGRGDGIVGTID